nr:LOW QUALITY PROTEIN: divergent protein kinase domain 1C-like [Lytechinus pictus]
MRKVSKRLLVRSLVLGMIVLAIYFTHKVSQSLEITCLDEKAKEILKDLCQLYEGNQVDGNLCYDLCQTESIQYVSCFNYHKGKVVFRGSWNGRPVIMKSKYSHLSDYPRPFASVIDKEGAMKTVIPDMALFTSMVYHQVQGQFGFELGMTEEHLLKHMWKSEDNTDTREGLTEADIVSLWALLQQEEYIFYKFWNQFHHFPEIYGMCGHFYFLEYVPPGYILNPSAISMQHQLASLPWLNRAKVAMSMMEFLSAVDDHFPEKLHLCDVKHNNFGVTQDWVVKAIDVDITFFQNQLDTTLNQPECTSAEDCHFFDCKGSCNATSGRCNSQRSNTNLQAVCADIFNRHYGTPGLLRLPPTQVAKQLDSVLQECLQQKGLPSSTKISETTVYQRLLEVLKTSLQYVER